MQILLEEIFAQQIFFDQQSLIYTKIYVKRSSSVKVIFFSDVFYDIPN